jgi:hypothetical protein
MREGDIVIARSVSDEAIQRLHKYLPQIASPPSEARNDGMGGKANPRRHCEVPQEPKQSRGLSLLPTSPPRGWGVACNDGMGGKTNPRRHCEVPQEPKQSRDLSLLPTSPLRGWLIARNDDFGKYVRC